MDREEVIEALVAKYRGVLEEKDDEDLLGEPLEALRDQMRGSLVALYEEYVESLDDEGLLRSDDIEQMRQTSIDNLVEQYRDELDGKTDDELEENGT